LKLSASSAQIIIVLLIGGLIAFIYFNGRNNPSALLKNDSSHTSSGEATAQKSGEPFNYELYKQDVKKQVGAADATDLTKLEEEFRTGPTQELMLKLAEKYDKLQKPALSAYYYNRLADARKSDPKIWALAGKKYFEAQGMFTGTPPYAYFVSESMKAYDRALALNPKDLDSKADQAVNFIEGKQEPMKGVGMLREILQIDSNNRQALLYLGVLSMQSGQYPKAIGRFKKLAGLDPGHADYHRYLGEAYISAGQKAEGRAELEKYKSMITDPRQKEEVDGMLKGI
jgi:predicted Zn-dependent protease